MEIINHAQIILSPTRLAKRDSGIGQFPMPRGPMRTLALLILLACGLLISSACGEKLKPIHECLTCPSPTP